MMRQRNWVVGLALMGAACTTNDAKNQQSGPKLSSVERYGDFTPARTAAVLPGKNKPIALFGEVGVVLDEPKMFGMEDARYKNAQGRVIFGGLQVLDTSTGKVRRLTSADGLPTMDYNELTGDNPGEGTVPAFDLAWVTPDVSFVSASWTKVVRGELNAKGDWTFKASALRTEGATDDAHVTFVSMVSGSLYAGTDQGVAEMDPNTLAVKQWLQLGDSCAWIYGLASGHVNGPSLAVACSEEGKTFATNVRVVAAGDATARNVNLPDGVTPSMVSGLPSGMLVGGRMPDGRGILYRIEEDAQQNLQVNVVADVEELDKYARPEKPFVPNRAAYDAVHGKLLLGGLIPSPKPDAVGGLLTFDASPTGEITSHAEPVFNRPDPYFSIMPWEVNLLEVDAAGRWYVGGRQLCNEYKAKTIGVVRIEMDGKEKRMVRPFVSGVRSFAIEPGTNQIWLGTRDEIPGLTCDAYNVQQHVCRLKADGSCEVYGPNVNSSGNMISPNPGASAIAFGSVEKQEFALATRRDATFVRRGQVTDVVDTQINPGISLWQTAAAWDANGALWLGSEMPTDVAPPNDTSGIDWDKVNDRSPHGLGYIEFGEGVTRSLVRRYVRKPSDIGDIDRPGMPSNTVWDVLPLPGQRHALVAMGIERLYRAYDHWLPEESQYPREGCLAEVNGDAINIIAPPANIAWGDVVSVTPNADGSFLALDADAGLVRVDLEHKSSMLWAAAPWAGKGRARMHAVDSAGNVAVATSNGLYIFDANGQYTEASTDGAHGQFWSARAIATGVFLAGADQGFVRVVIGDAKPGPLGLTTMLPREPWTLELGCDGAEGCECHGEDMCQFGLSCICPTLADCACGVPKPPDPCVTDPGSEGCQCKSDVDCADSLVCECTDKSCSCQTASSGCDGTAGCPCSTDKDCADGYECQGGFAGSACSPIPTCDGTAGCPCSTDKDCAEGYHCQGGIVGFACSPNP